MNNEEKIKEFLSKNNGYITTSDFLSLNISKVMIPKFIEKGLIEKVAHGIYMDTGHLIDEYYVLQKRFSNIVFSYNTAFHILNLTNRTPYEIDMTTIRGNKISNINKEKWNIHYVTKEKFEIGIIEVPSPSDNPIKVYNAERSICDMLKNEDEFDLELRNRILNYYFHSKDKDLDKLIEYSKIFHVYDKVNTIIEVMMKW